MFVAAAVAVAVTAVAPTPYDILVAQDIVYAPPAAPPGEWWPRGRAAVLFVTVRDGVIDPALQWQMFPGGGADNWAVEVGYVRRNVARVKGAPAAWEGDWLPPAGEAYATYLFNVTYANHLRERMRWEPDRAARICVALSETEVLAQKWYAVYEAGRDVAHWDNPRRGRLADLRELLGEEAWAARELPPTCAAWSFAPR